MQLLYSNNRCDAFVMGARIPEKFKMKIPPAQTKELDRLYDFLFDFLQAGWAGRFGHHAYCDSEEAQHMVSDKQDGYLYVFKHMNGLVMTADSSFGNPNWPEITILK